MRREVTLQMLAAICAGFTFGQSLPAGTPVGPAPPAAVSDPAPRVAGQVSGPERTPGTNSLSTGSTNAATDAEIEKEYQKLLTDDDDAAGEVDRWIRDNQAFQAKGAGIPRDELNRRIRERFDPVRKAYEDFLNRHPNHARARVAYGSFLGDIGDEAAEREQMERALTLDPKNPAIYNNLANIYGHDGEVRKAFEYYAKAIDLNPLESTYYHNFGTTVYLFRKDAMEFYGIKEQEVFEKALGLYRSAMRLDPENFPLATDVATTYYGIKPLRPDEALGAWTNALHVAHDEVEREGVYIHLARINFAAGRIAEAMSRLAAVTNTEYGELKTNLLHNIQQRATQNSETNPPATTITPRNP